METEECTDSENGKLSLTVEECLRKIGANERGTLTQSFSRYQKLLLVFGMSIMSANCLIMFNLPLLTF
jgi:hypothetical protein